MADKKRFANYLLSDIDDSSAPPQNPKPNLDFPRQELAGAWRKVLPRLRMLQLVVDRRPISFCPHASEPKYRLTFFIERLACGHEVHVFPQGDSLTAKRRCCPECADATGGVGMAGADTLETRRNPAPALPSRKKRAA